MKKIIVTLLTILSLFFGGYYSLIMAGNHLNSKTDDQIQVIVNDLKQYFKANGKLPEDIASYIDSKGLERKLVFGPLSTEIKIHDFENDTCFLEYLLVPFGPLAGVNLGDDELYYSE